MPMKTILVILLLLSFFSFEGNAQRFKHFEVDTIGFLSNSVSLIPISCIDPAPTDRCGRFLQTKSTMKKL